MNGCVLLLPPLLCPREQEGQARLVPANQRSRDARCPWSSVVIRARLGLEHPGAVGDGPAHAGSGKRWTLRSLPTQTTLGLWDFLYSQCRLGMGKQLMRQQLCPCLIQVFNSVFLAKSTWFWHSMPQPLFLSFRASECIWRKPKNWHLLQFLVYFLHTGDSHIPTCSGICPGSRS